MKNLILIIAMLAVSCSDKKEDPTPTVEKRQVHVEFTSVLDSSRLSISIMHSTFTSLRNEWVADHAETVDFDIVKGDTAVIIWGINGKPNDNHMLIKVEPVHWSYQLTNTSTSSKQYLYIFQ